MVGLTCASGTAVAGDKAQATLKHRADHEASQDIARPVGKMRVSTSPAPAAQIALRCAGATR
jgi:hypothetical protein